MEEKKSYINESSNLSENFHEPLNKPKKIYSNVLEAIGNTPLIQINNITKKENIVCQLLLKCDFFNPAGSAKDRAATRMVNDAEKKQIIKPNENYTLIEPSSGNTGIGLALNAIVRGYKLICTLPKRMSQEKEDVLTAMGAKVIRCENVTRDHPLSNISIAKKMSKALPNTVNLDQYENRSNPMAHYDQTAEELLEQCDGKIDYFIVSPGTGGTITGVSRKLKEKLPNVKIIAIDPSGSILAKPDELNVGGYRNYKIEGVGQPFIPGNVTYDCVDEWVKVEDKEAFVMARRLLKEEGLMVGGSSGLAFAGAVDYIKKNKLDKDKRVIVFSCDGIRNYLSTFLSDDWMIENNFMTKEEYDEANYKDREDIKKRLPGKIGDIKDKLNEAKIVKNIENIKVRDLIKMFNELKIKVILALNEKNKLLGYFSKKNVTCCLASCKADLDGNAINVLTKDVRVLSLDDPLYFLSRAMPRFDFLPVKIDEEKYLIFEYENIYDFLSN